jgi:hypothetical protein
MGREAKHAMTKLCKCMDKISLLLVLKLCHYVRIIFLLHGFCSPDGEGQHRLRWDDAGGGRL